MYPLAVSFSYRSFMTLAIRNHQEPVEELGKGNYLILSPVIGSKMDTIPKLDAVARYFPSMLKARGTVRRSVKQNVHFVMYSSRCFLVVSSSSLRRSNSSLIPLKYPSSCGVELCWWPAGCCAAIVMVEANDLISTVDPYRQSFESLDQNIINRNQSSS
jgi:hypothetical protein